MERQKMSGGLLVLQNAVVVEIVFLSEVDAFAVGSQLRLLTWAAGVHMDDRSKLGSEKEGSPLDLLPNWFIIICIASTPLAPL